MLNRRDYAVRTALAAATTAAALLAFGVPAAQAQSPTAPVDMGLTISDSPDPAQTNDPNFQYSFEVRNFTNTNIAYAAQVVFDIPHHVSLPSIPNDCYLVAGDKLLCNMGSIEPGGVRNRSIPVKHLLNGPINFQGTVNAANQPDPVPGNNTDFETTTVNGTQAPSWTVSVQRFGHGTVRGHGISCGVDFNPGLDCTEPFSEGGTATLRANDKINFIGWGGDCAFAGTDTTCSLPVTGNMNVVAHFVDDPIQPPVAQFEVPPGPKKPGIQFQFDASQVQNATTIEYKINGPGSGGNGGFTVPATSTHTGIRLNQPGTYQVTQTVTGPAGNSLITKPITISGNTNFLGNAPPNVAFSTSAEGNVRPGPAAVLTCAINGQLVVGLAEAQGCFKHAALPTDLPLAERDIAKEWWLLNTIFARDDTTCLNLDELPARCAELAAVQGIDIYFTEGDMMLNGMKVDPAPGAAVVFYPAIGKVVSSNAKITFEGDELPAFPAHNGPLNLSVGTGDFTKQENRSLNLFSFCSGDAPSKPPCNGNSDLPDIGGFKIDGQMSIALAQEGARRFGELAVNMTLPEEFATSAETRPSGGVKLQSTNAEGIVLSEIVIDVPEAFLGSVRLTELNFTYKRNGEPTVDPPCGRKWWKARGEIYILPEGDEQGNGLDMNPPPAREGVAFCAGGFHSAGGEFNFSDATAPQIFPGVLLKALAFNMQLDPAVFSGSGRIESGKIVTATGGLLVAFARPEAPYVIKAEDGGGTMDLLDGHVLKSTSFALGGDVAVILPGDGPDDPGLALANASFLYSYPDYVKADGLVRVDTFLYTIEAFGGMQANAFTRKFDAFVGGNVCLAGGIKIEGVAACVGGEARVSSKGTSACLILIDDGFEPGVGYAWGDTLPHIFNGITDGCKPSRYWETDIKPPSRRALAGVEPSSVALRGGADPVSFTVKPGDETKNVELHGVGGAPAVEIEAPNGETITTVPDDMQIGNHLQTLAWEDYDYTWISVTDGEPGEYVVTPLPGSPAIKQEMFETRPTPDEGITATVEPSRRGGDDQVLRYDVGEDPGQKVTFIERSDGIWNELGTATEGKGSIPFTPGPALEGDREIVAQYDINGIPGPVEVLDVYDAPPPPTADEASGVKVKRKGKKLTIKWKKVADATEYAVVVSQGNGIQTTKTIPAKKRTLKVGGIDPTEGGTVSVAGIGPLLDVGAEDTATFKSIKKKPERRIPYDQLGEGGPEG